SSFEDSSSLVAVLSNFSGTIGPATCSIGSDYNPNAHDGRKIRVTFNDGSGPITISQNQDLHSIPFALQAASVGGIDAVNILQANETGSYLLNQSNLEQVFDGANFTELMDLINGTSSQYMSAGSFSASLNLNSQKIENLANPTVGTDATNKNYV